MPRMFPFRYVVLTISPFIVIEVARVLADE